MGDFPIGGVIAGGAGALLGGLSNLFGPKKKVWGQSDLDSMGWKDYDQGEANKLLLQNAANLINRRKSSANAKSAQYGLDPVSSSYQMEDDIMDSVAGQAGDIYAKSVESKQNKARMLASLNANEPQGDDIFGDILSGAGLGLEGFSKFYKPMNKGGVIPDDPDVPENTDVYPTKLAKNEGVLNSEAMNIPGVKQFLKHMNKIGLSLREHTPSAGAATPLKRGMSHMKDGGVIGEAKRSETGRKKNRKGKGISLRDRINSGEFNIGEILGDAGFNTLNKLTKGNMPEEMDPRMLRLFDHINGISDKLGSYRVKEGEFDLLDQPNVSERYNEHRIEAGLTYSPLTGGKLYKGVSPTAEERAGGLLGELPGLSEDINAFNPMNIHTHDLGYTPSGVGGDQSVVIDNGMKNYIAHKQGMTQYDENGLIDTWTPAGKRRKKAGMNLLEFTGGKLYDNNAGGKGSIYLR